MRRTGMAGRGLRLAAAAAVAGVLCGWSTGPALAADSIRAQEWHLDAMHAEEMWRTSTGTGVTVAVIDGGVRGDAPDLAGQLVAGTDLSTQSGGVLTDGDGHGTSMSTVIAGTGKGLNGNGAYGLAPGAKILPIKVDYMGGGGRESANLDQIARGITYAADHNAKVINISSGIPADALKPADLQKLKAAVEHATSRGSLVFAAAGNSGNTDNHVEYPAAMSGVVGVGATDQNGKVAAVSEYGPQVALAAPGTDIYGACNGPSGYCKGSGTSGATALVSASAALIWSAHPDWTANQVLRVLINTASNPKERSDYLGYGTVRPRVALTEPGDPGAPNVSPLPAAAGSSPTPENSGKTGGAAQPSGSASAPADSAPGQGGAGSQPSASADGSSKSNTVPLLIGGGAAVVVLLIVVVIIARRNRRPSAVPVPPQGPPQGPFPGQAPLPPYGQAPQPPYGQAPQPPYGQPQQPQQPPYGQPPYGQQPPSNGGNPYAN
ncbi:type VII secretion-associated serine protease mycosin [Kitasatospora sp. NPDC059795]|uniref:type VII secretion-associated serine protease mycosin n=1 Tax=Kitasatospora sp. NPDC059795 TaxID=3346949 RepID=UPI003659F101